MSEPIPPTAETTPVASPDPAPLPGPQVETFPATDGTRPAIDAPSIPGDRLAAPLGATRVIADYGRPRASFVFLALVSIVSLAADVASKSWAEHHLDGYPGTLEVWKNHVTLILAKNRGGAWGLLQSTSENVRRPFFLLVSVAAIAFIMTLYRRLHSSQRALKWGLPLVLGGALGNVFDRIRYGHVIDFIDAHVFLSGGPLAKWFGLGEHHWPTFNIADVAICVGVGLMAIDMFAAKRGIRAALHASPVAPAQSGEPSVGRFGFDESVDELPPAAAPPRVDAAAPAPGEPQAPASKVE